MKTLVAIIITLFVLVFDASSTTVPTSINCTIWRPSGLNEDNDISMGLETVLSSWNYTTEVNIESSYGCMVMIGGAPMYFPPSQCTLEDFVLMLSNNKALIFVASHANSQLVVASVYVDYESANFAKTYYENLGYTGLSTVSLPEDGCWGLAVNSSFISSRCNATIVIDVGCYNNGRTTGWWNASHLLGHDQSELGPDTLTNQIINFCHRLNYLYSPNDLSIFPAEYVHSFAEADAAVDTLTMHCGGDIVLGPTFIPWERKFQERDGIGPIEMVFDLNIPCIGSFSISSFNSDVATVIGSGVNGDGDLYVQLFVTGAGLNVLRCESHFLLSADNTSLKFNGDDGFSIQFTVDTTPAIGVESDLPPVIVPRPPLGYPLQ